MSRDELNQKKEALLTVLKQCWYLPDTDKKFWMDNIETLPVHTIENVIADVAQANKIVSDAIIAALEANPDNNFLKEINSKIRKIKEKAYELEEDAHNKQAEDDLEQKLKEI